MNWGAIVIGSGLGGMTTAAYLTTNGVPTLVLEQYDTVGGYTQVFRRKKQWEFDVGVHYIGDCAPGGAIPMVLRGLGLEDRVEFNQLDPDGFTTLVFPGMKEFRVPAGWDKYLERLIEAFPDEERGIRRCVNLLEKVGRVIYDELEPADAKRLATFPLRKPYWATMAMLPLSRVFDMCGLSEGPRAVICGESGDYASPPSRTSTAAHAGFMHHYIKSGAYYPKGGGQVLAANLLDVIQSHGGAVRTQASVERVVIEGGRAVGVKLATGEVIRAPIIVSNADIKRTYFDLVGREHVKKRTIRRIDGYRMALPLATVYLGLDMDLKEAMSASQYWAHTSIDVEERYRHAEEGTFDEDPAIYITSTTIKDPGNPHVAPPGCSVIELMAVAPPHHEFWRIGEGPADAQKYSKNPEYRAVKERLTDLMIDRADALIPGLKEHIVWREAASPITQERYTLASGGSCYGIEPTTDQMGPLRPGPKIKIGGLYLTGAGRPQPKTEIPGLYLTGAATVWCHGIVNVLTGGVGTASAILGRKLGKEIREGRVFADPSRLPVHDENWDALLACRRLADKPRSHKRFASSPTPAAAAASDPATAPTAV